MGVGGGAEAACVFGGSYLAAGGWRGRRTALPLWACAAALVACRTGEAPCAAGTLPVLRDPPAEDPATSAAEVVLAGAGSLAGGESGRRWAGAVPGHILWHSARVRKLLLLPWQPPNQKWVHLDVRMSKW